MSAGDRRFAKKPTPDPGGFHRLFGRKAQEMQEQGDAIGSDRSIGSAIRSAQDLSHRGEDQEGKA
eukprot:7506404-Heterocapsa_arctica.AAC.1